jgi:hypothetical protein
MPHRGTWARCIQNVPNAAQQDNLGSQLGIVAVEEGEEGQGRVGEDGDAERAVYASLRGHGVQDGEEIEVWGDIE